MTETQTGPLQIDTLEGGTARRFRHLSCADIASLKDVEGNWVASSTGSRPARRDGVLREARFSLSSGMVSLSSASALTVGTLVRAA
jgi:hypothetical protein